MNHDDRAPGSSFGLSFHYFQELWYLTSCELQPVNNKRKINCYFCQEYNSVWAYLVVGRNMSKIQMIDDIKSVCCDNLNLFWDAFLQYFDLIRANIANFTSGVIEHGFIFKELLRHDFFIFNSRKLFQKINVVFIRKCWKICSENII